MTSTMTTGPYLVQTLDANGNVVRERAATTHDRAESEVYDAIETAEGRTAAEWWAAYGERVPFACGVIDHLNAGLRQVSVNAELTTWQRLIDAYNPEAFYMPGDDEEEQQVQSEIVAAFNAYASREGTR